MNTLPARLWAMRAAGRIPLLHTAAQALFAVRFRPDHVYTIGRGPLAGYRWLHHGGHQFWQVLGAYEPETAEALAAALKPGATFVDAGAHAGYFTLLGSRLVGEQGRVVAFEPVPENADVLIAQLEQNRLRNVRVEAIALSNASGHADFGVTRRLANAHLASLPLPHAPDTRRETIRVPTETLDHYAARTHIVVHAIKIDVEGAEVAVLEGACDVLRRDRPWLLVSTHSPALQAACARILQQHDYVVAPLAGFEHELVATPA